MRNVGSIVLISISGGANRCGVEDAVCPLLRLSPTPVLSPHSDQRPITAPGHRFYVKGRYQIRSIAWELWENYFVFGSRIRRISRNDCPSICPSISLSVFLFVWRWTEKTKTAQYIGIEIYTQIKQIGFSKLCRSSSS